MFDFGLALVVAFLVLIDWLMGKDGRQRIRQKMGDVWTLLADQSFASLGRRSAQVVLELYGRILGDRIFSRRHLLATLILSTTITTLVYLALVVFTVSGAFSFRVNAPLGLWVTMSTALVVGLILPNWVIDFVSLSITHKILERMITASNSLTLLLFVATDLFAAVMCAVLSVLLFSVATNVPMLYGMDLLDELHAGVSAVMSGDRPNEEQTEVLLLFLTQTAPAAFPTLLHLCITFVWSLLRLSESLVRRPVMLLLERLYSSEKGVLTIMSIAIGSTAKLLELYFKL